MARMRTTWREKLANDNGLPAVVPVSGAWARKWPGSTVAIPAPREVDAIMRSVGEGRLTTVGHIMESVARRHQADFG